MAEREEDTYPAEKTASSVSQDREVPGCAAALTIGGEHFRCDWDVDENGHHDGWGHANKVAQATWIGDDTEQTTASIRIVEDDDPPSKYARGGVIGPLHDV